MAERRKILTDHKKKDKTLVPPFTHVFGPMGEVSWVNTIIPELAWIGLIQYQHGHRRGVELVTNLARSARDICPDAPGKIFAAASNYSKLSSTQGERLRDTIATGGDLLLIQESLEPLVAYYPDCPLRFLYLASLDTPSANALPRLKTLISSLYQRYERDPMMVQATAVWLAFDAGVLKVHKGVSLAQFREIERYPETDLSEEVGSSIRSTLNVFFGSEQLYENECPWPLYFWNRGLAIDSCEFSDA